MALALVVLRAVLGVKVVHPDCIVANGTSKQVASVGELDFTASFDLKGAWLRGELLT